MSQRWWVVVILSLVAVLAFSCIPKPSMDYSKERLGELVDIKELMWTLYHDLGPVWKTAKQESLSPEDLGKFSSVAQRVEAVSSALISEPIAGRFKEGFAGRATALGDHARTLQEAAAAGDEAGTRQALEGINGACGACHKKFK